MKALFKSLAAFTARLIMMPLAGCYHLGRIALGSNEWFQFFSQLISLLPGKTGSYLRREFYRMTLKHCSGNCVISFGTVFSTPEAEIHDDVYIGLYCFFGRVRLLKDTLLASRVSIVSGTKQHGTKRLDMPIREQPGEFEVVTIGQDCWIGEGAIVAASIGDQSIIGCGAVITKEVEPRSVMLGNPARCARKRT